MVHNGIEYGMMAAYAEGLNILENADAGKVEREADAETAPLEQPEYYQYDIDIPEVAEVWRRGSVVGSWLLDLTAAAMQESPDLSEFAGRVSDSGEGRWTSIAAIDEGVPAPVLTAALYERFSSRGLDDFGDKVLSAMRKQFGGHDEKKDDADASSRSSPTRGAAAQRGAELIAAAGQRGGRGARHLRAGDERRPHALGDAGDARRRSRRCPGPRPSSSRSTSGSPRPGSEDRNLTHLVLGLSLEHQAALRPMPVTQRDLDAAAARVRILAARAPSISSTSASAPTATPPRSSPATPVLEVDDRRVALTEGAYQDHRRMTLTYPALAAARRIVWLVTGAEKREPLAKLLAGDASIPAGRVENDEMVVVADEAAAGA